MLAAMTTSSFLTEPFTDLGQATVPDGTQGPWTIETFEVTPKEAERHNTYCAIRRQRLEMIEPGTYRRLTHAQRGVVMSTTPMEVRTHRVAHRQAAGRVLINGLGLGMFLEAILHKPEVTAVTVVEVDVDILALVGPHFARDPRVTLVHADAMTYRPAKGETFDVVWHDIWDDIQAGNLSSMFTLSRRYARRAAWQGAWSKEMALDQRERGGR
jgi:hypothetical protein